MSLSIIMFRPELFGNLQDDDFVYTSNIHPNFYEYSAFPTGTQLEKHVQRQLMGTIRSYVDSLQDLECLGSIQIRIGDGECEVIGEFKVISQLYAERVRKTIAKIERIAARLRRRHPNARLQLRYNVYTNFPEIKIKALLRKKPAKQTRLVKA